MNRFTTLLFLIFSLSAFAQMDTTLQLLPQEKWWGGAVTDGSKMPFTTGYNYDMYGNLKGNQAQPLLLSNRGRVLWSEAPFQFEVGKGELKVKGKDKIRVTETKQNLKDGFAFAAKNYFPADGKMPDALLFEQPQYNTWIELIYNQNQRDILAYAHAIIDNGFPPGVLMIDDNWQEAYGKWKFHPGRFPTPKLMMKELHDLGFKVMLWVCPFVSPDTDVFRSTAEKGLYLRYPQNQAVAGSPRGYAKDVAMIGWWNGYSALLDFSNPQAQAWFRTELQYLVDEFGVDGFKLDAGDASFYPSWLLSHERDILPNRHSELFAEIGLDFPLNEYRATWKMAGKPLAQRLRDKGHNWEDLQTLIPNITTQGLMGYAFTCPDMIGGGEFTSFLNNATIDQELIVRSAQVHALMPMMQFSVAPWRILDKEHLAAVKAAIELRKEFTPLIMQLAESAAKTGEPIVRNMEYVFPNAGYAAIKDQFLLGDDILVAPVLAKNQTERKVVLPTGKWKSQSGKVYDGGKTITIAVGLDSIPYFEKM
ncbi:MAG: glycoside hydrolase family 31 protein [Saprospiraceae bacterium]